MAGVTNLTERQVKLNRGFIERSRGDQINTINHEASHASLQTSDWLPAKDHNNKACAGMAQRNALYGNDRVLKAGQANLGAHVAECHGMLAENLDKSAPQMMQRNAFQEIAKTVGCDLSQARSDRLQHTGAHVALGQSDVKKVKWNTQYTPTCGIEQSPQGDVKVDKLQSQYKQGDGNCRLQELRQPEHIPAPRSSVESLNSAYWNEIPKFTPSVAPAPVSDQWQPHLHQVSTPAMTAGPGPALRCAEAGRERQRALNAEERQVQELLAAFLAEAGVQASDAQVAALVQSSGEMGVDGDAADEDEDVVEELCRFCKPKGTACCLKCLLGKGSKKVVNFGGNKHGFAP